MCESIINLEEDVLDDKPSDDHIELAEKIMNVFEGGLLLFVTIWTQL
jgi:hypothetical protein